ncbi:MULTISPECIES: hypothetical protein [unclassified Devosia]|uniref:hypothetical protein n=1 Tax=unclassified Devosia TaxID=196773 RepID=UPI000AEEC48F|nr:MULTISPECIES: hypothetical protein [unclassified Devosia]MBN9362711.1 hypothetical protein [Devosia sp.]
MFRSFMLGAALAAGLALPAAAAEVELEAAESGQIEFVMPSGNIGCIVTPEGGTDVYEPEDGGPEIMCDRVEPDYVRVVLGTDTAEELDEVGDSSCCGAEQVLHYGEWASVEGFVCYSKRTGLTCTTEDEAHGFQMARSGIETW